MKLISDGPPSYRGSAFFSCIATISACQGRHELRLRRVTQGCAEWVTVIVTGTVLAVGFLKLLHEEDCVQQPLIARNAAEHSVSLHVGVDWPCRRASS